VQEGDIKPRELAKEGFAISSLLQLDKNAYFTGEHSLLALGDDIYVTRGAQVVFSGVDFLSQGGRLFVDRSSSLLVIDSIFQNGEEEINGITWVNVEFRNTVVTYNGGPLRLRNVKFVDCRLGMPPFRYPTEIADAITSNLKQPVNYAYEPDGGQDHP